MKKILLATIGLSVLLMADFSRSSDGVVADSATGLQWQDDSDAKTVTKKWTEAIAYCESLTLGGHNDWRLPNINELKSIVDASKVNPAIADSFENVDSDNYWSSTTNKGSADYAWFVNFYDGGYVNYDDGNYKDNIFHVRCVRGGSE